VQTAQPQSEAGEIASDQIIKGQEAAARYAGVSKRTIRRWVFEEKMPLTKDGCYIKTILDLYKANRGKEHTEVRTRIIESEANSKEAKAKLLKLELQMKQADLHSRSECEQQTIEKILIVKRGLQALPKKVAARLPAKLRRKVEAIIDAEIRILIAGFAKS